MPCASLRNNAAQLSRPTNPAYFSATLTAAERQLLGLVKLGYVTSRQWFFFLTRKVILMKWQKKILAAFFFLPQDFCEKKSGATEKYSCVKKKIVLPSYQEKKILVSENICRDHLLHHSALSGSNRLSTKKIPLSTVRHNLSRILLITIAARLCWQLFYILKLPS